MNVDLEDGEVKTDYETDEEGNCEKKNKKFQDNTFDMYDYDKPRTSKIYKKSSSPENFKNISWKKFDNESEKINTQIASEIDDDIDSCNPFDKLDPQMIELKIKALKSLFTKTGTDKNMSKRLVKVKSRHSMSPKIQKRNRKISRDCRDQMPSFGNNQDENNEKNYTEMDKRNMDKINKCQGGDYQNSFAYNKNDLKNIELEVSTTNSGLPLQHSPSSSSISTQITPSQPMLTQSSIYSDTLLQTQLVQDQLLYNYYQTAGLLSFKRKSIVFHKSLFSYLKKVSQSCCQRGRHQPLQSQIFFFHLYSERCLFS